MFREAENDNISQFYHDLYLMAVFHRSRFAGNFKALFHSSQKLIRKFAARTFIQAPYLKALARYELASWLLWWAERAFKNLVKNQSREHAKKVKCSSTSACPRAQKQTENAQIRHQ